MSAFEGVPMASRYEHSSTPQPGHAPGQEVELLKVVVTREGQKVSAQWAIHPQIKVDLLPHEWQQVSELMATVTRLVSARFADILASAERHPPGNA